MSTKFEAVATFWINPFVENGLEVAQAAADIVEPLYRETIAGSELATLVRDDKVFLGYLHETR